MINLFTYLGGRIEAGAMTQITTVSTNLSAILTPFLVAGLTIWVMVYAFAVIRGEAKEPMNRFIWDMSKKSFILMFAVNVGLYQTNIVADVNMTTNLLTNSINATSTGDCTVASNDSQGIYTALDCSFIQFSTSSKNIIDKGDELLFSNIAPDNILAKVRRVVDACFIIIFSSGAMLLTSIAAVVMYALIFLEVVVVRIILTMLFALGPLFIAAGAFEPTKKYSEAWVNKLFYCVILQLIIVLFITISVGIISGFVIETMNKITTETDFMMYAAHTTTTTPLLIITMFALAFVFLRLPGLAGELTGSSSASSGVGGAFVGGAVGGATGAFRAVMNLRKGGGSSGGSITR